MRELGAGFWKIMDTDSWLLFSFNDLAWTESEDSSSRGVIAGALENGSLDLWDADKLLRSARFVETWSCYFGVGLDCGWIWADRLMF